jgi:hypothetical protein
MTQRNGTHLEPGEKPNTFKAKDWVSTEQRRAYTPHQRNILQWMSNQGIALIKIDPLEPETELPQGGFLVSYKVRDHDIEMLKLPRTPNPDEVWTLLALHLEHRSQELG